MRPPPRVWPALTVEHGLIGGVEGVVLDLLEAHRLRPAVRRGRRYADPSLSLVFHAYDFTTSPP